MWKALGARFGFFQQSDDLAYQSLNDPVSSDLVEKPQCSVVEEAKARNQLSNEEKTQHVVEIPRKKKKKSRKWIILGGIVYLRDLYSNLVGNRSLIESLVARADEGLRQALEASLETLRAVYELQAPGWDELKQRVEVSFVKKTSNTNTSLTSGIATKCLTPDQRIGILNCGTGNVKFQFYQMDRSNVVRYLYDATPVQLSLSSLAVPPLYVPKVPLSSQAISGILHRQLAPLKAKFRTQVRAVITGPLRACWEEAKDQKQFEEAVARVFEPLGVLPWNDQSYFVTQDEEGALEHLATSNLVRDLEAECDLMISFGIGKGGCQWATPSTTIKLDAGMGEPEKLLGPNGLENKVLATFSTPAYITLLLDFAGNFARPVIALKSGCLLWLERDPYLLDVLVQSPARPPRNYGPVFQRGQSLLVLLDNSVVATRVLGFENHRHMMELPFADDPHQQSLSVDLRSTRFIAAPSLELDRILRDWREISRRAILMGRNLNEVVNEFRKKHNARGLASGGFLVPEASCVQRAVRRGVQVYTYNASRLETEKDLRDSSGRRIGKANWPPSDRPFFLDMEIHFEPTFRPEFVRSRKFKFCSWVPIDVELTSVPCLELGTRLNFQPEGIYTLEMVDSQGIYHWRVDSSTTLVEGWPLGIPGLATRFSYRAGVKLIVLRGNDWVSATVCGLVKTQHLLQLEGTGEKVQMDLNDFNHTWREVLVDDSGGYDACMRTHKATVEQDNSMVEDAITGKKLRVADQLLAINIRKGTTLSESKWAVGDAALELKGSEQFDIKNVNGLVDVLLEECQNQNRHIGCYRVPAFIIVAAPGSGKTWTMRQLVYLLARVPGKRPLSGLWPMRPLMYLLAQTPTLSGTIAQAPFIVFVQVLASLIRRHDPHYRECGLDFVEFYIRHTVTKPAQRQFLLQAFRMRTVIVIVDGIDEASDLREVIVDLVLRQLYDRGHTLVATSRPEGVQRDDGSLMNPELKKFTILDLEPLTTIQQKQAINAQLVGNKFYDNLAGFSEVRSKHDITYSTLTSQWEVEKLASVDKTKQADGKLNPDVRQRGANGELLQTRAIGAPALSMKLRSESKLLGSLLEKLQKQEQKEQTEEKQQQLLQLPPPRLELQALTRSSLWELVVAATDELYSIAEKVCPKLKTEVRKMCDDAKIECKLEFAPLKDPIRVFEKALDDYWDRFQDEVPATACVTDIIRCRFVCPSLEAVAAVSQLLIKDPPPWLELVRAKNKFRELDCAHFRNILFNFRVLCCAECGALANAQVNACKCKKPRRTSHLFEIQVHHEEILDLSEKLHAHVYYEYIRAKSKSIKPDDLDFMVNNQMQFFEEIRSSPVLLSLLILILDSPDVRLPNSVYQLYEMAVNISITRFVEQRPQLDEPERLKEGVLQVVQKIAYRNHMDKKRAFEHLPPTDPDYGLWNEICLMGGANGTTGLSFIKVIAQMELYQFTHLSFQEYLFWGEAIKKRQPLNFHAMVRDVWNYNALRIGVSNPKALVPRDEPSVWRNIKGTSVDLCCQLLKFNNTVEDIYLIDSKLVELPRVNHQVKTLVITGSSLCFKSISSSGLVDCKLQTLDLTGSIVVGLPCVLEALRGNPHIQSLHLPDDNVAGSLSASLFASNPSLVAMTLPLNSLEDMLEFVKAFQRPTGLTVLVISEVALLQEAIKCEAQLQMWGFNDEILSPAQSRMNRLLANHAEAAFSADLMCVAPAGVVDDGPVTFVSLSVGVDGFAVVCLNSAITHLDLRGHRFGSKSLPQLMLCVRNFQALTLATDTSGLECLLSLMTHLATRKITVHVDLRSSSRPYGLFGFEDYRLMKAARFWGVTVDMKEMPQMSRLSGLVTLLLAPFVSVCIWTSLAGHVVLNTYQDLLGARSARLLDASPFNFWNLVTFSWIVWLAGLLDLNFDITSEIVILCSFVGLLLIVLFHNLIGRSEIIPPERRVLSTSVFTWFELWSYLVHLVIMGQLLVLLSSHGQDFEPIFAVAMLDIAPISSQMTTLWLWGSVAATAAVVGAMAVVFLGQFQPFALPEEFYLGCGIFEVPIMFHLLGHCIRTIREPAWSGAYASVTMCVLALFMLANSSVWMYFKRVYSGRNILDPGEWYLKLDLMLKFIVVFLFHMLVEFPQVFLGLAAVIFLAEFVLVFKLKPCTQMKGNYFHMGCLAVLMWSALYSITALAELFSLDSFVSSIAMVGGSVLILAVTVLRMSCVKKSVHMVAAVGSLLDWPPR